MIFFDVKASCGFDKDNRLCVTADDKDVYYGFEAYEFWLDLSEEFESFFNKVCLIKKEILTNSQNGVKIAKELEQLAKLVSAYHEIHNSLSIKNLVATLQSESIKYLAMVCAGKNEGKTEKKYQKELVENFNSIKQFKDYDFIKQEYKIESGRIDILAKDKHTNQKVIMELKIGGGNPNRQLRHYDYLLGGNNILIGITEYKTPIKENGIIYYTYDELLNWKIN